MRRRQKRQVTPTFKSCLPLVPLLYAFMGKPGHIMGRPDVRGGPDARIIVQRRYPHDHMGLMPTLCYQMGAAARTEMPELTRRRFNGRQQFLSLRPAKMFAHYASGGDKRRRMYFAAACAVAVADRHVQLVHLIADTFAEATSIQWVSHKRIAGSRTGSS